jgi:4-amino-4-deoxy-L-arabinose transferase-like glycosyltransferase
VSVETPAARRQERGRAATTDLAPAGAERPRRPRRLDLLLALGIFIAAIVPRAAWIAYNDRPPQGLNDPALYMLFSEFIADGKGYIRPPADFPGAYTGPNDPNLASAGHAIAYYPVGYPATVGALKKAGDIFGWGRSTFSVKMANGVFGAITSVLVFLLALRLFDRRVAVAAGLLHAVFPSQVYYTGAVLSEALFTMLWMAALLALLWHPWTRAGTRWPWLLGAGLLLSAATMTRGITLMFPAVLLVVWLFQLGSWKRAVAQALIVWAGVAVLIVPWSVRNSLAFGTLVGPSTNVGDDLCIGNFYGAQGAFTLQGPCFEGTEGLPPHQVEIERNREGTKIAIKDVLSHPARMPKLIAQKAYWLLYKDDDGLWAAESYGNDYFIPGFRREVLAFAANSVYYATALLALAGGLAFALSRDWRRLIVVLAALYVLAIPLVFFGDPRFHFPAVPLMAIVAAWTVVSLWDRRAEMRMYYNSSAQPG